MVKKKVFILFKRSPDKNSSTFVKVYEEKRKIEG